MHRSYRLGGDHIRIEFFDDRIEIESPGRFTGIVDLTDPLEAPRFARNPRIARVCSNLQFGQELGEGIRRIYEDMRLSGLHEPVYRQTAGSVRLVLSGEPMQQTLDGHLTPEARAVSVTLREARQLSTGEVAVALGRRAPTRCACWGRCRTVASSAGSARARRIRARTGSSTRGEVLQSHSQRALRVRWQ